MQGISLRSNQFVNGSDTELPTVFPTRLPHLMIQPINPGNSVITAACALYAVLFLIGIMGNSGVLSVIMKSWSALASANDTGYIYVMTLSCVDFIVLLTLPFTMTEMLISNWIFGDAICKIYWTLESTGKVLSSFILSALSFERYQAVCHPWLFTFRTRRAAVSIVFALLITACLLLLPLPLHASVEHTVHGEVHTVFDRAVLFYRIHCSTSALESTMFSVFTGYIFVMGYTVPAVIITACYCAMIRKLCLHTQGMTQSTIPVKKITMYTVGITTFYFLCWTPYWFTTVYFVVFNPRSRNFVYAMYFVHALPYVNSAFNWVFYAALNTHLQGLSRTTSSTTVGGSRLGRHTTAGRAMSLSVRRSVNREYGSVRGLRPNRRSRTRAMTCSAVLVPEVEQEDQLEDETFL